MKILNLVLCLLDLVMGGALAFIVLVGIITGAAAVLFTLLSVLLIIGSKISDLKEKWKRKRLKKQVIREWKEWEYTQPPQQKEEQK